MSYIRSIENPEKLYIFGNGEDTEFYEGSEFVGYIPTNIFNKLIDLHIDNFQEDCQYCGASIEETFEDGKFRMRLSYTGWPLGKHIDMWNVTWTCITENNYGRSKPRWKRKLLFRICDLFGWSL
jgi:hypothetical protein